MTPLPRFPTSLLVPVALAALAAGVLPGVPWAALAVVAVALAVRMRRSARSRDEARPRFWLVFWTAAPCFAASIVPVVLQVTDATLGPVLLAVGLAGLAAALLSPPTPAGVARTLALAVAVMTGVIVVAPPVYAVAAALLFLGTVVPTVLALPAEGRSLGTPAEGLLRRVRGAADGERPRTALGFAAAVLVGAALAAGGLLFAVLPSDGFAKGERTPTADEAAAAADDGRGRAGSIRPDDAITGGGAGASSGFRSLLRTSPMIELTVRVDDGLRGPEPLYLRGMTYDVFDGKTWTRSAAADTGTVRDAAADGWVDVAPPSPSRPRWRLRVEDLGGRAGRTALWALPGTERVLFEDRARETGLRLCADGAMFVARREAWAPEAVYLTEGPATGLARGDLGTRRSDASVSPLGSYVAPPPEATALAALAAEVAGDTTTPSDRAARIEAWMRSARFAYERTNLDLDRTRPVADFLLRTRAGHCWCFASGMALLLRATGQPARLAVGYRPSDYLATAGLWTVRGSDAHAWCEVYYEGRGWIVYDPTPGVADAYSAVEARRGRGTSDFVRFFGADGPFGRAVRAVGATLAAVGGGLPPWAWAVLGAVVAAFAVRRVRRRAAAALAAAGGRGAEGGAYARALAALATLGLGRRRHETPREYLGRTGRAVPDVAPPLRALTHGHDDERYGGRVAAPEGRAAADAAAAAVVAEVRRRRDG